MSGTIQSTATLYFFQREIGLKKSQYIYTRKGYRWDILMTSCKAEFHFKLTLTIKRVCLESALLYVSLFYFQRPLFQTSPACLHSGHYVFMVLTPSLGIMLNMTCSLVAVFDSYVCRCELVLVIYLMANCGVKLFLGIALLSPQ